MLANTIDQVASDSSEATWSWQLGGGSYIVAANTSAVPATFGDWNTAWTMMFKAGGGRSDANGGGTVSRAIAKTGGARSEARGGGTTTTHYVDTGGARSQARAGGTKGYVKHGGARSVCRGGGTSAVVHHAQAGVGAIETILPRGLRPHYRLSGGARSRAGGGGGTTIDLTLRYELEDEEALIALGLIGGDG